MPQLIPFYLFNQLVFSFCILIVIVFMLSKYFLPNILFKQVLRTYITKLTK